MKKIVKFWQMQIFEAKSGFCFLSVLYALPAFATVKHLFEGDLARALVWGLVTGGMGTMLLGYCAFIFATTDWSALNIQMDKDA